MSDDMFQMYANDLGWWQRFQLSDTLPPVLVQMVGGNGMVDRNTTVLMISPG